MIIWSKLFNQYKSIVILKILSWLQSILVSNTWYCIPKSFFSLLHLVSCFQSFIYDYIFQGSLFSIACSCCMRRDLFWYSTVHNGCLRNNTKQGKSDFSRIHTQLLEPHLLSFFVCLLKKWMFCWTWGSEFMKA